MNTSSSPILLVDDDPEMCWALARILTRAGSTCQTAATAQEAITLAERQSFRMAFLDAKLPDGDGLDLARRLQGSSPGIRIALVSGFFYREDPIIVEAIQSGLIAVFIAKPFVHADILRTLGDQNTGEAPPVTCGTNSIARTP